ncbi:polysaccharide biosynthesis protein [Thioalkalivibrio sulfidiphilus]|uniref:polysaccharide biosynthesis protein n=1 Tax=Thioalkalivibrio sulfidiphilus TaxID=1033854 RepID=UPI003BAF8701
MDKPQAPFWTSGFFSISARKVVVFIHDLAWVPAAVLLGYWVRFNLGSVPAEHYVSIAQVVALALVIQAVLFWGFGLYRGIWRFASIPDMARIAKAVLIGTLLISGMIFLMRLGQVPRSVVFLYPIFLTMGLVGPRLMYRWIKDHHIRPKSQEGRHALIIGAGKSADFLLRDLLKHDSYQPIGILDDSTKKWGHELHGVRVLGGLGQLEQWLERLDVEVVLVAIPSASPKIMRHVVDTCASANVECVTLPSLVELADGQVTVSRLRPVRLEDLLGRPEISLDDARVRDLLSDKCVLVTGAGGSIGSELVRQVAAYGPSKLVLLDHGEFNLYRIEHELAVRDHCPAYEALLGDVRDERRMRQIFEHYRPEIVLHAAAYKHVPLVEGNPEEGIRTNVGGTRMVADLAVEYGVERFVLVSTDKAVNPTNVMGATKRVAELYCQGLNELSETAFITTRFGNVLGSAGSVVPLFRQQIEQGGPITVTHPEITRYFMTIPEAVSLILQATAMGEGGEIFVLDMGEPVRIVDLAREMIRLSGFEPDRDIEIHFVGLRPGEKLHEELFHAKECLAGTTNPKILRAAARSVDFGQLIRQITALEKTLGQGSEMRVVSALREIVPEFSVAMADKVALAGEESRQSLH